MHFYGKKSSVLIAIIFFISHCFAQNHPFIAKFPLQKTVDVSNITHDYFFNIQMIEMPVPGGISQDEKSRIRAMHKEKERQESIDKTDVRNAADKAALLTNFEGNIFNGRVPNDNHLAISNGGKVVSVINSVINYYQEDSQMHNPVSLDTFGALLGLPQSKYDPRILYDPEEDRFIMAFLNGYTDVNSCIFIAFSQSNDPTGKWNIYTLPGNPLSDSSWSDFPMIAITDGELFLTINLLRNMESGESWKNTFKQTLIWQIDKSSGYAGDSLITRYHNNLEFEGKRLRNICPVKGGSQSFGPDMYFLSNRNFTLESDSFFIIHISGKLDDPQTKLTIRHLTSDNPYGAPPMADQPVNRLLETNDARVLDAYFENNQIHFVGNTINFDNNLACVYHGTINSPASSTTLRLLVMKHPYLEFGYPSIAYTGINNNDEAIILANHTSDTIFPGISAFFYKEGQWSEPIRIKNGETTVTVQLGKEQRWGDYTGLQRKYNEQGLVWGSGYFGKFISSEKRYNSTWICQLKSPTFSSVSDDLENQSQSKVFPTPAYNWVRLEFQNNVPQECDFHLFNSEGKLVKYFQKNMVKKGLYTATFNISHLPQGNYFLLIKGNSGLKESFKIVVQ